MEINIFDDRVVKPFEFLGLKSDFWSVNIYTLKDTWIAMAIIVILVLLGRFFLRKDLNPAALLFQKAVAVFDNLCRESFGTGFKYQYFCFVSTIFFFTLFGCLVGLLPYVEEATKDLNTAFALGSLSFLYVQVQTIKVHGIVMYLREFTQPFFLLLPLNIVGEFAKVASMSFRLFGNILGGAIILLILLDFLSPYKNYFIIGALSMLVVYWIVTKLINVARHRIVKGILFAGLIGTFFVAGVQFFFGLFEGAVQAFVLTMLTITYLAVAIQEDAEKETLL